MKRIIRTLSLITPLLFTLASAPDALAYYDPGVQRWINRDPLGEQGFETQARTGSEPVYWVKVETREGSNLYRFTANNSINRVDPFGESILDDLKDPNSKNRLDSREITECDKRKEQEKCRQRCRDDYDEDYDLCDQKPRGRPRDRCHQAILRSLEFCIRRCNGGWYGPTP